MWEREGEVVKLDRLAHQGLVSIAYRQHYLALASSRQWYLPVRRRVYILKLSRLARLLEH